MTESELYTPVPGSQKAIIVDIDGTIAHICDRDIYDYNRVHEDTADRAVTTTVMTLAAAGYQIIYCTGRSEDSRSVTQAWLDEHMGLEAPLFMRADGDARPDAVVKLELFDRFIRDHYDVLCVFEDLSPVVKAWRSIGLAVFQVAKTITTA